MPTLLELISRGQELNERFRTAGFESWKTINGQSCMRDLLEHMEEIRRYEGRCETDLRLARQYRQIVFGRFGWRYWRAKVAARRLKDAEDARCQ